MQKDQYRIMSDLEDKHWWFLAKRGFINAVLPAAVGNLNILDVGCGTGGLSRFLAKWGKVTGLEIEKTAMPFLKKRHIKYISASADTYRFPSSKYGLVCIFDVLYHRKIKNDASVLVKAYNSLKPGGLLCVTDSACPWLYSKHDEIMQARERYSLSGLEAKVKKAGFEVIKKSYIYFLVFPLFVISRLLNKIIGFSTVERVNPAVNSILLTVCKLEAKLLGKWQLPIGSSVIILARK